MEFLEQKEKKTPKGKRRDAWRVEDKLWGIKIRKKI